jgi:hypothetical protein
MVPSIARANGTDTSTVTGTLNPTITVDSPSTIAIPLAAGTNTTVPQKVTITTNTNGWSLSVADTSSDEKDGRMSRVSDGTDLYEVLEIRGGDLTTGYYPLSSSQTIKVTGSVGTTEITDIVFRQSVSTTAASGTYSITLTFTATPGS